MSKAEHVTKQAKNIPELRHAAQLWKADIGQLGKISNFWPSGTKLQSIQHILHIISPSKHNDDGCHPSRSYTTLANLAKSNRPRSFWDTPAVVQPFQTGVGMW
jgi:hypothetical protein